MVRIRDSCKAKKVERDLQRLYPTKELSTVRKKYMREKGLLFAVILLAGGGYCGFRGLQGAALYQTLGLTVGLAGLVYFLKDRDLHDKVLEQERRIRAEYPMFLQQLSLYLSAGMTLRGAFGKLAAGSKRSGERRENPLYVQLRITGNELAGGMEELRAYEEFGKRCGGREYARLCTMLCQNLRKGNSTILLRLEEERNRAMTETLLVRKRKGEEMQTMLLLPMILLMALVMLLVMIPAFGGSVI